MKTDRTALVNRDDPHFDAIVEGRQAEILTFSLEQAADFTADDIHYVREHDFVGVEFQTHGRYEHDLRVGIPGKFNVDNALAAAGVCSFFDLPKEKSAMRWNISRSMDGWRLYINQQSAP